VSLVLTESKIEELSEWKARETSVRDHNSSWSFRAPRAVFYARLQADMHIQAKTTSESKQATRTRKQTQTGRINSEQLELIDSIRPHDLDISDITVI
jgi:hypothetical protein